MWLQNTIGLLGVCILLQIIIYLNKQVYASLEIWGKYYLSQKTPMREGNSGFLLGRTDIGMVVARWTWTSAEWKLWKLNVHETKRKANDYLHTQPITALTDSLSTIRHDAAFSIPFIIFYHFKAAVWGRVLVTSSLYRFNIDNGIWYSTVPKYHAWPQTGIA